MSSVWEFNWAHISWKVNLLLGHWRCSLGAASHQHPAATRTWMRHCGMRVQGWWWRTPIACGGATISRFFASSATRAGPGSLPPSATAGARSLLSTSLCSSSLSSSMLLGAPPIEMLRWLRTTSRSGWPGWLRLSPAGSSSRQAWISMVSFDVCIKGS